MANPLFSTYTQGENRVTFTLMAVLENINNQLTEDLLEAMLDESDFSLVTFENQLVGDGSVPEAGSGARRRIVRDEAEDAGDVVHFGIGVNHLTRDELGPGKPYT